MGPTVREVEYLWTTVAYVLWPSGARKLLQALPGGAAFFSRMSSARVPV